MKQFGTKMTEMGVDVISTKTNTHIIGGSNGHELRQEIIEILLAKYFGDELSGSHDIKIISIWNGGENEPNAAKLAYKNYLNKQDKDVLDNINTSLHTIKFVREPTWTHLEKQWKWVEKHIAHIVKENNESTDYIGNKCFENVVMLRKVNKEESVI